MTSDLDLLLKIERELTQIRNEIQIKNRIGAYTKSLWEQVEKLETEQKPLKSQIESKLAQADFDKTMLQHHKIQSEKKEQELSQLRPIVQLVEEFWFCTKCHWLARLDKPSEDSILRMCTRCNVLLTPLKKTLESILASSEVNNG